MDQPESAAPAAPARGIPAAAWWVGIGLFCVAISLRPLNDPDIWFQLLAGRHVLDRGSVPHHDFFMYTVGPEASQLFGGWGFGLLAELAVRLSGFAGLSFFYACWWAAGLTLGLLAVRAATAPGRGPGRLDASLAAGMAVALLVAYQGFVHRSELRAEVSLVLAWMGGTLLFETCRQSSHTRRALVAFPLLCWALAWVHTTALLMLPLLASYALRRWLQRRQDTLTAREIGWWAACAVASLGLPVLNPNGAEQVFIQLGHWMGTAAAGSYGTEALANREYLSLLDPASAFMWPAVIVLAIGTAVWFALAGPARLPGLVAILPMMALAFQHRRGIGLWAMALMVPLACALVRAFRARDIGQGRLTALTAGCLGLLAASVLVSPYWGIGLAQGNLRGSKALQEISRGLPSGGNVWAFDGVAPQIAYLLGDGYKVGYAGHMVHRHPAAISHYADLMETKPGWESQLAAHGVSVVAVPVLIMPDTQLVALAWRLAWHPRWQLVAIDRQLLVFRKRPPGQDPSARERWEQATAATRHAVQMAVASHAHAPDPRTLALGDQLRQQLASLDSMKDQPGSIDWAALDRAAGTAQP